MVSVKRIKQLSERLFGTRKNIHRNISGFWSTVVGIQYHFVQGHCGNRNSLMDGLQNVFRDSKPNRIISGTKFIIPQLQIFLTVTV